MKKFAVILLVLLFTLLSGCNNRTADVPVFYGEFCNAQRTSYKEVNGLKLKEGFVPSKSITETGKKHGIVKTEKGEMYRDIHGDLYPVITQPNGEKGVVLNKYEIAPLKALLSRDSKILEGESALPEEILKQYYPNKIVWKLDLSKAYEALLLTENAPVIEGNRAYLVSGSVITVVNWKTGEKIWRKDYSLSSKPSPRGVPPNYESNFDSAFFDSPVVYKDKIVIVGGYPSRRFLLVIDKNTGKPVWKSKIIGGAYAEECSSHPLVINGHIYLAATSKESYEKNGNLEAGIWVWDINTGKVLNKIFLESAAEPIVGKYRSMAPVVTNLACYESNIYGVTQFRNDSTHRTYIFCYSIPKRKFIWFAPAGEKGFNSPGQIIHIAVNKDFVAICMVGNQWMSKEPQLFIKVFDRSSHKPLWQNISATNKKLNPILTIADFAIHNDKLYAMLFDKRFICFDMKTGKEIWSFKDKDWQSKWWNKWNGYENCFLEQDVVITKDIAYFNVCNAIYAINPESGKLLWRKVVKENNLFINIMPVDSGLIIRYQDIQIGYDAPQNPVICELWK